MTLPVVVTDEVAWVPAPLSASPTYTAISTDRLVSGNVRRTLGQAGLMQGVYHNQDDALNPWNTAGAYYGNLLTAEQASLETGMAGWAASVNCSIAQSTTQALDGAVSLRLTSLGAG